MNSVKRLFKLKDIFKSFKYNKLIPTIVVSRNFSIQKVLSSQIINLNSKKLYSDYETMAIEKKKFQRLSKDVVPSNYKIDLIPDLEKFTFSGIEDISIKVVKNVKAITMHCVDIKIENVSLHAAEKEVVGHSDISIDFSNVDETVTFTVKEDIEPADYSLKIKFTGVLNDRMKGFYRSKYTTPSGETRYAAVTQFESTDARRSLPCWDEPALKATFDVSLTAPKGRIALSNMPVLSDVTLDDGSVKSTFEKSPIMSTYLLAFVVGEYDYIEGKDIDGVVIRVYTPTGKKEQGEFALQIIKFVETLKFDNGVAIKTLPFYKEYFDIAYPLPKMDLIAIADFASGAMENWGLVTYRETALLIDPKNSSSGTKQWVALVVGHEIAHQWFGNLVTMEWWTHLWLNEGFASWIEYLCVDHCFPEFDIWTQFASNDLSRGLDLDAMKNSHPIEVPVGHPDEVDEIFDAISYSKGACVIRMLHGFIGDEAFRKGMHNYLVKHQYKNTYTEDLWDALAEASGQNVADIMSSWTKQMGFPVLSVIETKTSTGRLVKISQEKFTIDGSKPDGKYEWKIPVDIFSTLNPDKIIKSFVLDQPEMAIELKGLRPTEAIKINSGSVGFYRTLYTTDMLLALEPSIQNMTLSSRDRLGLQNDQFALGRAGLSSCSDFLRIAKSFSERETNFTVWADLNTNLGTLGSLLSYAQPKTYADYHKFVIAILMPISKKLGWEPSKDEGILDSMLRSVVIHRLGMYGDVETIKECRKRFEDHVSGKSMIPADLRKAVYVITLNNGGEKEYEQLLSLLDKTDLHEEKMRILCSLGAVKSEELINRVLKLALSDKVRSQDTVFVIGGITITKNGRELTWKFVKANWELLRERFQGGHLLARLVKISTENFATSEKADEVEAFFKDHPVSSGQRTVQQCCENIRLNAKQLKRDEENIAVFLKKNM